MTRDDILALVARLREVDHPEARAVAEELEALAPMPPGRPPRSVLDRARKANRLRVLARAIERGEAGDVPEDWRLAVDTAKGQRGETNAVVAEIEGIGVRTVERARERKPMDAKGWEELVALVENLRQ